MFLLGQIGTVSSVQRTKYEVIYWKIDGFSTLPQSITEDSYYASPYFSFNNIRNCWLRFYPNGASIKPGFIELSILSDYHVVNSLYHLTLGVKTQSGRIDKWFSSYIFFQINNRMRFPSFKLKSEFLKRKEELVSSNCLTFVAFLSSEEVNIVRDVEDQTETCNSEGEGDEEKKGGEKVLEDLSKLLASGENSDFIIQVGDVVFKVHKVILSARCSVLSKMFLHETIEKATNKVTLEDCEPDIFGDFLLYLYTGSVLSLSEKNVFGLYRIADKYLTDDLKHQCLEHIQATLSVPTFCSTVKLALMYGERGLLQQAIDFAVKNIQKIVITAEWQNFLRVYPTEGNEIFIKCVCPQ